MERPLPTFEELCELEPRLHEVEAQARAIHDDGSGSFFCSNFAWLPVQGRLKELVGVHRKEPCENDPEGVLMDSRSFEVAYMHLSKLLPPCRDCGCAGFQPVRDAQTA